MNQVQEGRDIHPLTGLYESSAFFQRADERLQQIAEDTFCLAAIDIEHFRLFNKLYGRDEGDYLLGYVADCVRSIAEEWGGIAGYMGGDNFAVLMPAQRELLKKMERDISRGIKKISNTVGFLPAIGVFLIDDTSVLAVNMYDRATVAMSQAIGNYTSRICYYDASMSDNVEEEIKLLAEIQEALEKEEFTFFAQPQCDISTGKIVGAESLVRWYHHDKGLISPGVFIPVLEKSGFIADLDRYVWEKVCEWLRSWLDRGYHPIPISINVSRIDIFSMNVPSYLKLLMRRYRLQPKMLKIEITESAYAENNDKINKTVKELQDAGFRVMMDDFGSGYSSLNMLKNVAVDVLKIDMRFLDINDKNSEKGIGILESVVNMSRQMGVPIIVEGVETKKQEDYLLGMGCRYTQGFYYYKPLPISEFEKVITDENKLDFEGLWCKQVEPLHIREVVDSNIFTDTMLNNLLGATAFYDIYENTVEITRVNEQYYQLTGITTGKDDEPDRKFWNHVLADEQAKLMALFERACENPMGGAEGHVHYLRADGKVLWVHLRICFLREREGHRLFCGSLTDMTHQKKEQQRADRCLKPAKTLTELERSELDRYYGDFPCGFGVGKVLLDESGEPYDYEIVYVNRAMEEMCRSSLKRLKMLALRLFSDNRKGMLDKMYHAAYDGEVVLHHTYSSMSKHYWQMTLNQYQPGYVSCILQDETHAHIQEFALRGVLSSYREVYYIRIPDNYYQMIYPNQDHVLERGNYEEAINRHFGTGRISSYDEGNVRKFLSLDNIRSSLAEKDSIEYKYRRKLEDGGEEWCLTSLVVSERKGTEPDTVIMMIRSIDELMQQEEKLNKEQMAEFLASSSDGFFIYREEGEEKILYASAKVLEIYGCKDIYEFRELVGNSFRGMVHPEDLERVEKEIADQIRASDKNQDYVEYRIVRKDGQVRWISDCGYLDDSEEDNHLFYVFISDVTDKIRKNS